MKAAFVLFIFLHRKNPSTPQKKRAGVEVDSTRLYSVSTYTSIRLKVTQHAA